ncbi:MAG: magnesium transporter [Geminicoccaceae bacterium]
MTTTTDASVTLGTLSPGATAAELDRMGAREAGIVLAALPDADVREVIGALSHTRAAQLLAAVEPEARERVLAAIPAGIRSEILELFAHSPNTAGALMDPRITAFRDDMTVAEALVRMRTFKEKEFDAIYLMDTEGKLTCSVALAEIVTAAPDERLDRLSRTPAISVVAQATREEIVAALAGHRPAALPVVDGAGRLIGVIRHSALVSTSEAVVSSGMQTMVGAGKDEKGTSPISYAVRQRLPWLEINLATAFLAAFVVGLFEGTIAQYTALAVLLPVVAGQSGNSGMQALAVTLRGLALREISVSYWPKLVVKEAGVGIMNGLAVAAVTMAAVFLWSRSIGLVIVIGLAMVIAMVVAGISGALVPVALKSLRQDPALASSIVLTTVTDVMGFLTFLGLATIFSSLL